MKKDLNCKKKLINTFYFHVRKNYIEIHITMFFNILLLVSQFILYKSNNSHSRDKRKQPLIINAII